ncbi:MAG TPA: alpha/beta hydrolase [Solirubrobacteraceae bacterium]
MRAGFALTGQTLSSPGGWPEIHVDEHTIEVGGEPVFYRRAGAGDPPAVYLHSAPTSSDDWLELLAHTGGVAPDLPGFGRSAKGGHLDYSLPAYVAFLTAFLDAVSVDRVALVGHGWGAAVALAFAQRHPERVRQLVLIDAVPLLEGFAWPSPVRRVLRPGLGELWMGAVTRRSLTRLLRRAAVSPDTWSDERADAIWRQFDQGTQRAFLRLHRSIDPAGLAAAGAGLAQLEIPTLIVWGERDPWVAPTFADAYAQRLPRVEVQRVPDAGHWPWRDQPAVLERIAAFLAVPA